MRDEVEAMQKRLRLAHRINNPVATLRMCDEAADLLGDLLSALDAAEKPAAKVRKATGPVGQ
jgi:C4-dicarboxylate-specific signal transduction histidine kinase